ncbi:MAG TPA: CopG family transcriptional regulator [Mycobacteriales bacterium]|nr:CopG family transcriptional regulator [Mycobacteriales bacterium]
MTVVDDVRRTTVKLPASLDERVRQEAERRGMTLSGWTREAIEAHLPGGSAGTGAVRRLGAAGVGHSGRSDISERIEEILAAELSGPAE